MQSINKKAKKSSLQIKMFSTFYYIKVLISNLGYNTWLDI